MIFVWMVAIQKILLCWFYYGSPEDIETGRTCSARKATIDDIAPRNTSKADDGQPLRNTFMIGRKRIQITKNNQRLSSVLYLLATCWQGCGSASVTRLVVPFYKYTICCEVESPAIQLSRVWIS